ncbi:metalloregulator ArsR/SmtB family transcription factor [Peptoniphilus equinus]|uniref:Metalloregulator ArsR/SmtB family transcription factor n=1 Tax=Peptoniphilus equinus TaxID=3016343 RepID=A0ABY7QVS0_9FIRM|nr:metalloregulator ArsR/SmtB family transcription factor [Peptoniphilus equinus]WBW50189.1 metalloregulator ArsR/SmtB family transcription factor [Peptoniphilus equinus]
MNKNDTIATFIADDNLVERTAALFKSMSDPTRVKILYVLSQGEMNVTGIANTLGMSQSSISHQLAILRTHNIIKVQRVARQAIYSLDDDHVRSIFSDGITHVKHHTF